MGKRVQIGCADCKRCTNSAANDAARKAGRFVAGFASAGISEVATRKCRACGHAMAIHGREDNARWDGQAAPNRGASWGSGAGGPNQGSGQSYSGAAAPVDALTGADCQVSIQDDMLVIERRGRMAKMSGGSRSIPLSAIHSAEFKDAGRIMPGHIAVQVNPPTYNAQTNDKVGIMFAAPEQSRFAALHAFLMEVAEQNRQATTEPVEQLLPPPSALPSDDLAARLAKLEALRSAGLITEDEFAQRREQILDSI